MNDWIAIISINTIFIYDRVGVRLGEYDTSTDVDCLGQLCADPVVNLGVEAKMPHENYNEKSKNRANDIGLIRLSADVQYSEYIKPICLPTSVTYTRTPPNSKYVSAGWGRTLRGNSIYSLFCLVILI